MRTIRIARTGLVLASSALLIILVPSAFASSPGACASSQPSLGEISIGGVLYVDQRTGGWGTGVAIWVDPNGGADGLQRGDDWLVPAVGQAETTAFGPDPCAVSDGTSGGDPRVL